MKKLAIQTTILFILVSNIYSQSLIVGKVIDIETGNFLPGANIHIEDTRIGTASDEHGEFIIKDLDQKEYLIRVGYVGYENYSKRIKIEKEVYSLEVYLSPISIEFNSIVVTGTRTEKKRTEIPIIVNVLDKKMFELTNSKSLLDGLSYQTGVRMEVDCQTCNYSQVRLNGLGGSYSQILINSRPIFSPLSGLYGLEQIPKNMLDRVEVIRGGGSALFGSNAIAGTINIITKEPKSNSYSVKFDQTIIDKTTSDRVIDLNTTFVDDDITSGITLFANFRNRDGYDANGDGFTEIPKITNNSFGFNSFYKTGKFSKIVIDGHSLNEQRRGGDQLDIPPHQALQAEDRTTNLVGGGITYTHDFPYLLSSLSGYVSGQKNDRKHYTGVEGADGYGTTKNITMVYGTQFSRTHKGFLGGIENTITFGIEGQYDDVMDEIPGYNHYLDQITNQFGFYFQTDWKASQKLGILLGVRADKHSLLGNIVVNPRLNLIYNITPQLQLRGSYSTGFRAPQAFDADLHVAFAGGGISLIKMDPNLEKENSYSYSGSLDFNLPTKHYIWGITIEGFYTNIDNIFILEELGADPANPENTILLRTNGEGAKVGGGTFEARINYDNKTEFTAGLTLQQSKYTEKVYWSAELDGTDKFLKSPDVYGFFAWDLFSLKSLTLSANGVLTGPMYVAHVAGAPGVENDELKHTETFFELNLRASYRFANESNWGGFELYVGIQNLLNHYQNDFDTGQYRDSNYIYGPAKPRTVYAGIKVGYQ